MPKWAGDRVQAYLRNRLSEGAANNDPYLVRYSVNGPVKLLSRCARSLFKKLAVQVGLPRSITPHSGRATAATRLLEKGYDYRQVQEFLRYTSTSMVAVYDKRAFGGTHAPGLELDYDEEPVSNFNQKKLYTKKSK